MNNYKISEKQMELYKRFLTTSDYEKVAELSRYSFSTVNNILNRRTRVNDETLSVIHSFNRILRQRIEQTLTAITEGEEELQVSLVNGKKFKLEKLNK